MKIAKSVMGEEDHTYVREKGIMKLITSGLKPKFLMVGKGGRMRVNSIIFFG